MNNNKKVLALKYRPQKFDDLIGQKIISETIINSIKNNKAPNAYLFTGIRGIGKTTTARIVAKALNCKKGIDNISDDNNCENCHCQEIASSNHIDILEMDAASKTGVDDVRDLIEFSRYGPTSAKYKIFIIDEVHMLSKQAFNALLKTLEEPPEYLKFIFATTEIKKIPITVVSRCQRFDLSRIKSSELFDFIKKIKDKENGKVTDEALKLIVKISEGSVRDALSLLDRGMLSTLDQEELDLVNAQKIFGYFDKSQLIGLFEHILLGQEAKVLEVYRKIYDQGIEPKVFINDFLEILYYFKNIDYLTLEGTNFSLNDEDFLKIKNIADKIDKKTLVLYWQFSIRTLDELNIVSNQNLSIEMFLMRLIYLSDFNNDKIESKIAENEINFEYSENKSQKEKNDLKNEFKTVNQIKNVIQESELKPKENKDLLEKGKIINSFEDLLKKCLLEKEMKLKYELENNVNLVSFESSRIEISFNDNLDKNFVKDLSLKLFEWTNKRWIITFSKNNGQPSFKDQEKNKKKEDLSKIESSQVFKDLQKKFPDIKLIDIKKNEEV